MIVIYTLTVFKKILIIYQWKIGILGEREVDVLQAAAMSIVKDRLICPVSWNRTLVAMIFWQTAIGEYKFTSYDDLHKAIPEPLLINLFEKYLNIHQISMM